MNKNNNRVLAYMAIMALIWFTIIIFFTSNASAQFVNGGFETGNFQGWTYSYTHLSTAPTPQEGSYAVEFGSTSTSYFKQTVNLTGYNTLSYWAMYNGYHNPPEGPEEEYSLLNGERIDISTSSYALYEYDIQHLTGNYEFGVYSVSNGGGLSYIRLDNCTLSDQYMEGSEPSSIIFNPDVSISNQTQQYFNYSVNNDYEDYMYFVTSVWHAPYDLPNLSLIENWLNVEQTGENVQLNNPFNDLQTYHLNLYATTSAPPVISESFLIASSDEIYINRSYAGSIPPVPDPEPEPDPYEPDPNPIEDPNTTIPDDWNMTIPEKYQNVSWLTNYTGYFDDLTCSVNNSLYGVTGLVIKPLQSLNETVHVLRYHISNSKNMVAELSYLSVIAYYGWSVLPVEMQTIFVGVAAAGACIYLFKRRT